VSHVANALDDFAYSIGALLVEASTDVPHHSLVRVFGSKCGTRKATHDRRVADVLPKDDQPGVLVAALPGDFAYLERANYRWEVVYTDMEEFYARRLAREGHLDLMGGYKTFDEINTALDVMHATYPSITTAKFSIGQTLEDAKSTVSRSATIRRSMKTNRTLLQRAPSLA
jgi:hypothetical protein